MSKILSTFIICIAFLFAAPLSHAQSVALTKINKKAVTKKPAKPKTPKRSTASTKKPAKKKTPTIAKKKHTPLPVKAAGKSTKKKESQFKRRKKTPPKK